MIEAPEVWICILFVLLVVVAFWLVLAIVSFKSRERECSYWKWRCRSAEAECDDLREDVDKLEESNSRKLHVIDAYLESVIRLEEDRDELQNTVDKLTQENIDIRKWSNEHIELLDEQIEQLNNERQNLEFTNLGLTGDNLILKADRENLSNLLRLKNSEIDRSDEVISQLDKRVGELLEENYDLKQSISISANVDGECMTVVDEEVSRLLAVIHKHEDTIEDLSEALASRDALIRGLNAESRMPTCCEFTVTCEWNDVSELFKA